MDDPAPVEQPNYFIRHWRGDLPLPVSYWINGFLLFEFDIDYVDYARWVSPWLEEGLKSALILYLIRSRRVGLIVDAAIYGFAVGTGFALFENLYYLMMRPETHPAVQVIRGFYKKQYEPSDIRAGIEAAVCVRIMEPVFESQTKTKLGSTGITWRILLVAN